MKRVLAGWAQAGNSTLSIVDCGPPDASALHRLATSLGRARSSRSTSPRWRCQALRRCGEVEVELLLFGEAYKVPLIVETLLIALPQTIEKDALHPTDAEGTPEKIDELLGGEGAGKWRQRRTHDHGSGDLPMRVDTKADGCCYSGDSLSAPGTAERPGHGRQAFCGLQGE
jgi:hypothetical protein